MLEIVSRGFEAAKAALLGRTTLTEDNIDSALRSVRVSLLQADVELGVVRDFLGRVKARAVGEVVSLATETGHGKKAKKLRATPAEHFVRICHAELVALMGPTNPAPIVFRRPLTTIMMVGLQGVGKTTTCGKLAKYLLAGRRRPLLVAADIYRPAAVLQLQTLGERLGVPVFTEAGVAPPKLCAMALDVARRSKRDVVIFDTAGRLAIDDALMDELDAIKHQCRPHNTFLVCDAMAGQDAVRSASAFDRRLDLTGFILTKLDGDARGGAALSIKEMTGKPIAFLGMGETLDKLESFRPEGMASRILGMGDIVGLMQDFEAVADGRQAERDAKKMLRGAFTLEDFLKQLRILQKMGSAKELFDKIPFFGASRGATAPAIDDKMFVSIEAIIQSMTPAERQAPQIIDTRRATRIARGAGKKTEDVQALLQRFASMQQMMAQLSRQPGLLNALPGMDQLAQSGKLGGRQAKRFGGPSARAPWPTAGGTSLNGGGTPLRMGTAAPVKNLPGLGKPLGDTQPPTNAEHPGLASMFGPRLAAGTPRAPGAGGMLPVGQGSSAPTMGFTPEQLAALQGHAGLGARPAPTSKQKQRVKGKRKQERLARKRARR